MAEPLKNLYNTDFFSAFTSSVSEVVEDFNKELFIDQVYATNWEDLELKERMRRISETLKIHLSKDFEESLNQIIKIIKVIMGQKRDDYGFEYMFLPDFIEVYGQEDHLASIKSFKSVTQFVSCEFAVRPFIISHPQLMNKQMMKWAVHKNHMVRRLASEGFRPRLPWAMALSDLKKDPSPLFPMLELLKNDESETVRRSVANNLNDISKDHPHIVVDLASKWLGENKEVDWLVKHACRTLLKKGNPEVMTLFGFGSVENITIKHLEIVNPEISVGEYLKFEFILQNKSSLNVLIRLEYAIYFKKSNGSFSKKVFSISEKSYNSKSSTKIQRKQPFKIISTRKLYPGKHQLALIINGHEQEKSDFYLH